MNAPLLKTIRLLLLLPCLALMSCLAHAQSASTGEVPPPPAYASSVNSPYDIQIENGALLLAPLKNRVDVKALWGSGDAHGVPATIGNLMKYLRAADTNLTLIVSPGAAGVQINDLTMRSGNMPALAEALSIATDNKVHGSLLTAKDSWTFFAVPQPQTERTVEVFNLSGYIQSLGEPDSDVVTKSLNEMQDLILSTLRQLHPSGYSSMDDPQFRYHPGTKLLIVIGSHEAIEVSRKIINALSCQQTTNRGDQLDKPALAPQK
ncbi:MAG TPA: hypothetical protein VH597_04985 [Verrucomicrobiae bacterium]|jgi:hypothetical protein|nr:hypothetical protein [Verrucomicrobiae bacterium]